MNMKLSLIAALVMGVSAQAQAAAPTTWQPGKTKVTNGDLVIFKDACYVAKNNPGVWETPSASSSWFWSPASCGNVQPSIAPTPVPSIPPVTLEPTPTPIVTPAPPFIPTMPPVTPAPTPEPTPAPTTEPVNVTTWVPGKTRVANGDIVMFNQKCYVAKNSPGSWESPRQGSWFWDEVNCLNTPVTPAPVTPAPVTPAPVTPAPVTPAPVTPAPVTPAPVTPAPVDPGELTVLEDGKGGYLIPRAQLEARETALTSSALFDLVRADTQTLDNKLVEAVVPLRAENPDNVRRAETIVSEQDWDYLFPIRHENYTYQRFLQAIAKFPAFCRSYEDGRNSDEICKRSLVTMFAHFVQETGAHAPNWEGAKGNPEWRQGLYYVREMYKSETDTTGPYNLCSGWAGERWPCQNKSYFGRGAKQLSWNYNYGPFSEAMFGDKMVLLKNPELVADTWLNLASAVFFYVYPQPPKPSMLHVIDGTWQPNAADKANGIEHGFGSTIQIINGAFECGKGSTTNQAKARIAYYKEISSYLNLDITGEKLDCADMKAFDTAGAGALEVYWDKDWGWNANTPGNHSFMCKLAGYQTAYSAWTPGDYEMCVEGIFKVQATDEYGEVIPDGK